MAAVRSLVLLLLGAMTLAGCGRDALTFGFGDDTELFIRPATLELYRDQAFQVDVFYGTTGGTRSVLGEDGLSLEASPETVLKIDATGAGRAEAAGDGNIVARFAGEAASASVTVRDATLTGITVTPESVSLNVGQTADLQVTGTLSDGTTIDLTDGTSGTTYTAEPASVLTVGANGVITGIGGGAGLVFVEHPPFSAQVTVEVAGIPDDFVALAIEPDPIRLGQLEGAEFRVLGTRSSGEVVDLFGEGIPVELATADPSLIRISEGFVESLGPPGETFIEARLGDLNAIALVTIQVGPRELVGLGIEPEFLRLGVRESASLRVTGFYADGSTADLSAAASGTVYSVDFAGVVEVDADGNVVATGAGGTLVIARNQGFEAFTFVEVFGDRELIGLEVTPPQLNLQVNQQVQLTVTAFFSDGSIEDVTRQAAYLPTPLGIFDVTPTGLVRALTAGEDLLAVDYLGLQVLVPVVVQGGPTQVVEVRVTPNLITVLENQPFFGLDVVAVFSDGSQRSVLGEMGLSITTDDPSVAFWDGTAVVGLRAGLTALRATFQGVTGAARVQVQGNMAVLLGIQLSAPTQLGVGRTEPINVFAFYSDGSIVDITSDPQLTFQVDNPAFLTVGMGTVTGVTPGVTTLRAFFQGQQGNVAIRIVPNADPFVSIRWQPASLTLNAGASGTSRVIATRQSGLEQNVTNNPNLILAATGPVSFTLVPQDVSITGNSAGNGSVLATFQGLSATLPVTVQSTGPTLTSIQVVAPSAMTVGARDIFAVVAFFSDGTFNDITNDPQLNLTVTPNLVTINGNQIIANQAGTVTITATYRGQTSTATVVISTANDPVVSLTFNPTSLSIPVTQRRSFTLTATLQSGATLDVTFDPQVNYNFNGPFTPSPGMGAIDLLGQAAGMGTVTASYRGRSATLTVTVTQTGPTVTGILLNAPANLDLGSNGSYTVTAQFSDGTSADVTNDPGLMVFVENPAIFSAAGGVLTPLQVGTTRLGVSFSGFTAQRTINVVNNNPFTSIRFQPGSLNLTAGQSATVQVIARRANGATENVTAQVSFTTAGPVTLGPAGTDLPVLAGTAGTATVQANFNGLSATLTITIMGQVPPTISSLNPNAVRVGTGQTVVVVTGTMFQSGDTVVVDGTPVATTFVSGTQLRATFPANLFSSIDELDVQVVGTRGPSNTVVLPVGAPPVVTSYAPNTVVAGSSIDVVAIGTGLTSLTPTIPGLSATMLSEAPNGTLARIRVSASANVIPGPYTLTVTNPWGNASVQITVAPATGQMDLVVTSGQTLMLSGTNVFNNVTVNTGGRIVGTGTDPLALIATGNITIRGTIEVSGSDGGPGFSNPAAGGAAGPGGGGGGGGGDGNTGAPAQGGAGSPAGGAASSASGAGTDAGDGGGVGAGEGGENCGQSTGAEGGGGGGLGGNGGNGGGENGDGTGGVGGTASSGSLFGAGTGGGGGSTCGPNSGGGGGGGGGALILQVALGGTVSIEGRISADGGDGGFGFSGTGGGGGGSGGLVEVSAPGGTITLIDTISVRGGAGGSADFANGGGGGGGGRVVLDASPGGTVNTMLGLFDLNGGAQGIPLNPTSNAGRAGSPGTQTVTP